MLILAIDTSTRMGSGAALRDYTILAEVSGYEETPYSSRLFRDVELLQNQANFGLHEADLFAVAAGPGSFTGLRVGLTAVKAWAEVHRKPVAAVSGLLAIASQFQTNGTPSSATGPGSPFYIASFLDARRGQIFGAIYESNSGAEPKLVPASEEAILLPQEFLETVKQKTVGARVVFVSSTPEAIPEPLLQNFFPGVAASRVSAALAPAIGRLGLDQVRRGEALDPIRVDANYVRRSDAEASWKEA